MGSHPERRQSRAKSRVRLATPTNGWHALQAFWHSRLSRDDHLPKRPNFPASPNMVCYPCFDAQLRCSGLSHPILNLPITSQCGHPTIRTFAESHRSMRFPSCMFPSCVFPCPVVARVRWCTAFSPVTYHVVRRTTHCRAALNLSRGELVPLILRERIQRRLSTTIPHRWICPTYGIPSTHTFVE